MAGRPYYGYGQPPPGMPPGAPPGYPPMMAAPGMVYYPMHPAYFYPYPHPPPGGGINIVDESAPAEIVPTLPGETVELPWSTYKWVPACLSQQSIPPGALRVGTDADGEPIYAGRAPYMGDVLPAKVIPSKNACYVCHNGQEVLVPSMFSWQFSTNGEVPPGAVAAGSTADGEKLYYGRVTHDGCTTPGKIHTSHGCCYYPFDGEEKSSTEYEVLVLL
ncbi:unnamed protein product [Chilo suppressalis]|uniref:Uncharacterized protein n=1 Tax=Chilo suppressalis TaxID=168631 RepID=A0ABN8AXA3_CHISP|nr:unnamed protein product [Chilo suppressalis]